MNDTAACLIAVVQYNLLPHPIAVAHTVDQIEVAVAAGRVLAHQHPGVVRVIAENQSKAEGFSEKCSPYRSKPPKARGPKINGLRRSHATFKLVMEGSVGGTLAAQWGLSLTSHPSVR